MTDTADLLFTMPFGRYRGEPISEIPTNYLRWCLDDCVYVQQKPSLRDALSREWQRRITPPPSIVISEVDPQMRALIREYVRAGHKALVHRCHPDRGGDKEDMIAVNRQAELLRKEGWL